MKELELDSRAVFEIIRRRFWWIFFAGVLCGLITLAGTYLFVTPKYTASVSLYVYSNDNNSEGTITSSELTASKTLVDTYIVILQSRTVLDKVVSELDLNYTYKEIGEMIKASSINGTEAFTVSVENQDPVTAQKIANKIAELVPDEIVRVVKAGGVEVIDYASVPTEKSSPSLKLNFVIGFLIGAILPFVVFLFLEVFDTLVRTEEDLEEMFSKTIPVLGSVPKISEVDSVKPEKGV